MEEKQKVQNRKICYLPPNHRRRTRTEVAIVLNYNSDVIRPYSQLLLQGGNSSSTRGAI